VAADIYWQIGDAYLQLGQFEQAFESFRRIFQAYLEMGYLNWAAAVKSKESFEALRYSDIEHARRTREESLALARESQDKLVEAWGDWEMGEICPLPEGLTCIHIYYANDRDLAIRHE
jgi:tetratricopeptide (TPR) repeat protein